MLTERSVAILVVFVMTGSLFSQVRGTSVQMATYRVSGHVIGGPPVVRGRKPGTIQLLGGQGSGEEVGRHVELRSPIQSDGSFEFRNVHPGKYIFETSIPGTIDQSRSWFDVTDRDIIGVKVPVVQTEVVTTRRNLEDSWSLPYRLPGMTPSARDGTIYMAVPNAEAASKSVFALLTLPGQIREIDYGGKVRRQLSAPPFHSLKLWLAHFSGSNMPVLLAFGQFAYSASQPSTTLDLHAFDSNGTLLWTFPAMGIQDVAVIDSGAQNDDKVAIATGALSNSGIHVVDSKGKLVWESRKLGQVQRVFSEDVRGTGIPQIIAMSSKTGGTRMFDGAGAPLSGLDNIMTVLAVRKAPRDDRIASVFGWNSNGTESQATITGWTGFGAAKWTVPLPSKTTPAMVEKGALASGKPWLAVSMRDGQVFVIDVDRASVLANIDGQGWVPDLAWIEGTNGASPRLVLSHFNGTLHTFSVTSR